MSRWARHPEPQLPLEWTGTMRWAHLPAEARAHLGTEDRQWRAQKRPGCFRAIVRRRDS